MTPGAAARRLMAATRPRSLSAFATAAALAVVAQALGRPSPVGVAAGVVVWPFVEYAAHRWLLHGPLSRAHDRHHVDPREARHQFVPPLIVAATWGVARLVAGAGFALGLFASYAAFELLHAALHRPAVARRLPRALTRHHARHHYADAATGFAVTAPVLDRLFGTGTRAPHPWAVCATSPGDEHHPEAL